MARAFAEIAFTDGVRAAQRTRGSDRAYAGFLQEDAEARDRLGPEEQAFIAQRDGFYQASVGETGWPYVQFRGGPAGFLRALDPTTLGYADFRGNRQYLSLGNLSADPRVSLILMDYPNRRRLKIWGRMRFVEAAEDPALLARLHVAGYKAHPERAALIEVAAFDWNCPQHIPERLTLAELEPVLAPVRSRIAEVEAENEALRARLALLEAGGDVSD